jgi:hypothetical protein
MLTQAVAQNGHAQMLGIVLLVAGARVISVGVGDHRRGNRPPGVDMEVTRGAIQPFVSRYYQGIMHVAVRSSVRIHFSLSEKWDNRIRELLQRM